MNDLLWRDISTAPKDGTAIIAYLPDEYYEVDIVHWDTDGKGGLAWCRARCVDGLSAGDPTHWMPLPPAPC